MLTRFQPTRHTSQPARRDAGSVRAALAATQAAGWQGGAAMAGLSVGSERLAKQGNFGRNSGNYGESPG
jgi:hypothetical protein